MQITQSHRWSAFALSLVVVVLGCGTQRFNEKLAKEGARSAAEQQSEADQKQLAAALAVSRVQREYTIGPGDVLEISVYELQEAEKWETMVARVSQDGRVRLPLVGSVEVADRTADEAALEIADGLKQGYLRDPQVAVFVKEYLSRLVSVVGAVERPGVYELRRSEASVLAVLAKAGGLTEDAGGALTVVRAPRGQEGLVEREEPAVVHVDLRALIEDGDLAQNVLVRDGDVVNVVGKQKVFFYVFGYVQRPGAYEFKSEEVGVLEAVAMAGGLDGKLGVAENCKIVRRAPKTDETQTISVNLEAVQRGEKPNVALQPEDTIIIESSFGRRFFVVLGDIVNVSVGGTFNVAGR